MAESDLVKRLSDAQAKIKEKDGVIGDLVRQIKLMERIQNGQGRALDKITNDNEYPKQIRQLQEQVKVARDKVKEYEEKARKDDKQAMVVQERMVKLEILNRELKGKHSLSNDQEDDLKYGLLPPSMLNLDYKLQEANRVITMLQKSRDVL